MEDEDLNSKSTTDANESDASHMEEPVETKSSGKTVDQNHKEASTDNRLAKDKTESTPSQKTKKIAIIAGIIAAIIAIILIVFLVILPAIKHNDAVSMVHEGKYDEAIVLFENLNSSDSEQYIQYCEGMKLLLEENSKSYVTAIECFEKANNIEDSAARLQEANYMQGEIFCNVGSYALAKKNFIAAGDYENASAKAEECADFEKKAAVFKTAEDYYKEGKLGKAKTAYEAIDQSFEYNGIKVSDRVATLNAHKDFITLCGKWVTSEKPTGNTTQIWSSGDGRTQGWDISFKGTYDLECTCIIKDDGSVNVKCTANYSYPTSYSSSSSSVKGMDGNGTFSIVSLSVPSNLGTSGDASLSYENGAFTLSYHKIVDNSSLYFQYDYGATFIYNSKIEAY